MRTKILKAIYGRFGNRNLKWQMTVRPSLMFVAGVAGTVLTVTTAAYDTKPVLLNKTPEALRKFNEDKLEAMGVD